MKPKILIIVSAVAFAVIASNVNAEEDPQFSTEFVAKVLQRYVDDNALPISDEPVAQSDLFISHRTGAYVYLWRSFGLKGRAKGGDYANESRYFAGWTGDIGKMSVDAGIGYYDVYDKTDDLKTCYVEVSRPFSLGGTWKPSVLHEVYFTRKDAGYDGGTRTFVALSYEVEVRRAVVTQKVSAMYENAFGYAKAWTYSYEAEAAWKVSDTVSVILPSLRYIVPTTHVDGQERRLVLGVGARVSF